MKNTEEAEKPPLSELDLAEKIDAGELKRENQELKQENRRIKFLSGLTILILLDLLLLPMAENWAGCIVVGVLQLIFLLFLGKMLGIRDVDVLITKILNAFSSSSDDGKEKK